MNIQTQHPNDAVNQASGQHTVLFEDDKVRVLKVRVEPGAKASMHWHPRNINYVLAGGQLRFDKPDGTSVVIDLREGQVTSSPETSHAVENIGSATVEAVQVELKA